MSGLIKTFGASIETNIPPAMYPEFIKIVKQSEVTKSFVIDTSGENPLLVAPPAGDYGAWVLIPPDNDFTKIQQNVKDIFSGKTESIPNTTKRQ